MAEPQWYAIVFNQDRPKGQLPDLDQDYKAGTLWSVGSVVDHDKVPRFFDVVPVDGPQNGRIWNADARRFDDAPKT